MQPIHPSVKALALLGLGTIVLYLSQKELIGDQVALIVMVILTLTIRMFVMKTHNE